MMKNTYRSLGLALISIIFAIAATVLRCIATFTDMDYSTGFYGGSALVKIANVIIAAAVLILLVSLFLKVEKGLAGKHLYGPMLYVPSAIMSVSLLLIALDIFSYLWIYTDGNIAAVLSADRSCFAALPTALLAVCATAFFIISCVTSKAKSSLRSYLGMAAALFFGMYAAFLFFRFGGAIHQPQKIATEMAALAMAVFLLEETRISLGKERWNGYFTLGVITASLSAYAAFPALAVFIFKSKMIAYSWAELILLLTMFVFATCRIISATTSDANAEDTRALVAEGTEDILAEDERQITDEKDSGN